MMINENGPMPSFTELQIRHDQENGKSNPLGMRISKELDKVTQPKLVSRSYRYELPKSAPNANYVNSTQKNFLQLLNAI